ncbi:hypothetical protein LMG28688_00358 [Paraburkholderia caffeinitolerans]|uniref:Uncharacterized protein n=1 Tax=Paraburkholderia caffeinitolerans TaxID=1723730 RepID=A0A6J5FFQ3_9BURK|nr:MULTISPECIES: hypothetical protein [Paraburkholderia]CAB3777430.1 hypothetical protein LMG28688_00358 [Paraburkholderia caffeinitolerans]
MTQSMISFWVGLVVLVVVAGALSRRYRQDHPGESLNKWLDTHHMGWMHRKH